MKFYFSQASRVNQTISDEEVQRNALLYDLEKTKQALEIAYMGFDNVTEPELIDCYIYEVNAVLKRYNFILTQLGKLQSATPESVSVLNTETSVAAMVG